MNYQEIEKILLNFANVTVRANWPAENSRAFFREVFGDDFRENVDENPEQAARPNDGENLFAIIHEKSNPLKIDLKIDKNLAKLLREKYESVANAPRLDAKNWVEILATGQLADDEIRDLLRHSYEFAKK